MNLEEKVKSLPDKPGCYLFKNANGKIIYVGKAISLIKRVSSYFNKSINFESSPKTELLVKEISDLEYVLTDSEFNALIKEVELIKKHKPKYNKMYKDDKSYSYLHITDNEKFPRFLIVRLIKGEESPQGTLFGPFLNKSNLDLALDTILKIFPASNCKNPIKKQKRPCLRYQYKKCLGPCIEAVSEEEYKEQVENIKLFFQGQKEELIKKLRDRMELVSKDLNFEKAAELRDKITGLEETIKNIHFTADPEIESLDSVKELQEILELDNPPERIAGFDIGGSQTGISAGSLVIFQNGIPKKEEYRKFKMKTEGPNDYGMMQELIERRYKRVLEEDLKMPDLILIDGGLGQVNAAHEILKKLNMGNQPIIGIAKKEELIYLPYDSTPIKLPRDSKALWLLQRIRDEAHRFAINYHKTLRKKSSFESVLDNIQGIGKKRRNALLTHFNSVESIKNASIEELIKAPLINQSVAEKIKEYFKNNS